MVTIWLVAVVVEAVLLGHVLPTRVRGGSLAPAPRSQSIPPIKDRATINGVRGLSRRSRLTTTSTCWGSVGVFQVKLDHPGTTTRPRRAGRAKFCSTLAMHPMRFK